MKNRFKVKELKEEKSTGYRKNRFKVKDKILNIK